MLFCNESDIFVNKLRIDGVHDLHATSSLYTASTYCLLRPAIIIETLIITNKNIYASYLSVGSLGYSKLRVLSINKTFIHPASYITC